MGAHEADAVFRPAFDLGEPILLDSRVAGAAVTVDKDAVGALEGFLIPRPAIQMDAKFQTGITLEALGQQLHPRVVFVGAGAVAGPPGHKQHLTFVLGAKRDRMQQGQSEQDKGGGFVHDV